MENKFESKTVQEYFDAQPEKTRKALIQLRSCILETAPSAKELLNYKIPAYSLVDGGKRDQQIMIAGYKNHVGFYPHPTTMEKFNHELSDFKKGKGSVQFPVDKPLPLLLIERMIRYRLNFLLAQG